MGHTKLGGWKVPGASPPCPHRPWTWQRHRVRDLAVTLPKARPGPPGCSCGHSGPGHSGTGKLWKPLLWPEPEDPCSGPVEGGGSRWHLGNGSGTRVADGWHGWAGNRGPASGRERENVQRRSGKREKSGKGRGWEERRGVWAARGGARLPAHGGVVSSGLHEPPRFGDEETEAQEINVFASSGTPAN